MRQHRDSICYINTIIDIMTICNILVFAGYVEYARMLQVDDLITALYYCGDSVDVNITC